MFTKLKAIVSGDKFQSNFSKSLQTLIFLGSIFLFTCLLVNTINLKKNTDNLFEITNLYQNAEDEAFVFNTTSDYMTSEAHYFVTMGNLENLQNYFIEVKDTKRREESMRKITENVQISCTQYIERMMELSRILEQYEVYAFRLVCDAYKINDKDLPEEMKNVVLNEIDQELDKRAKLEKALKLLFAENYQVLKMEMKQQLLDFYDTVLSDLNSSNIYYEDKIRSMTVHEIVYIVALFLVLFLFFCISGLVGSSHRLLLKINRTDTLTGVFNREAFNKAKYDYSRLNKELCFVMIDVDHFKEINDTFGHDIGDRVLKEITRVITEKFREEDAIYRIGGDEFVMILNEWKSDKEELLLKKWNEINEILHEGSKEVPPTTVSVGIAFSHTGYSERLQKHADIALYLAKGAGRACARIYQSAN